MQIVCFGCGEIARKFLKELYKYNDIEIEYFLDNNKDGNDSWEGYQCFLATEQRCKNKYIVITVAKYYEEIKNQLLNYGLREGINFVGLSHFIFNCKNEKNANKLTKKIWFEDFWPGFDIYNNFFLDIMQEEYKVILDDINPDYIFCSVFGKKALSYGGIRIAFTGENTLPDFNEYDYVIGFEYITYEDRYLRWPLYKIYESYKEALNKHKNLNWSEFLKRDFCCRVVSNGENADSFREYIFEIINSVKPVASGGKYKNNLQDGKPVENKKEFLKNYKFNLAIENSFSNSGYTTEKIVDAWAAGCIPIYWGNKLILKEFNKDAFINCHNFNSLEEIVDYILKLLDNPEKMKKMVESPICNEHSESGLKDFLRNILSQTKGEAYRRINYFSHFLY